MKSNHLRTMVIHDNLAADLFDDDSTYTDPSIPCSGSTAEEMMKGHNGKQDNRTMIVHGKVDRGTHRSRRQTTESELTATVTAGTGGRGHSTLLSPSKGDLGDHARYSTFVIHDDAESDGGHREYRQ